MAHSAPGRHHRRGITSEDIHEMFSTDKKAEEWFVETRWGSLYKMFCPNCGATKTKKIRNRNDSRSHFVRGEGREYNETDTLGLIRLYVKLKPNQQEHIRNSIEVMLQD